MVYLLVILFIAAMFDLRYSRIPNLLVLILYISGVSINIFTDISLLIPRLYSFLIIFAAFYFFYLANSIGAGDVKLLMAVALYVEVNSLIFIIAITFILALIKSILYIIKTLDLNLKRRTKLAPYIFLGTACSVLLNL